VPAHPCVLCTSLPRAKPKSCGRHRLTSHLPSLPRFPLPLPHHPPQPPINPRLVAAPLFLEPGQHIGVQTQRDRLLACLVHPLELLNHDVGVLRLLRRSHQSDHFPPSCSPGLRRSGLGNSCLPFHLPICIELYVQFRQYKMFLKEHFSDSALSGNPQPRVIFTPASSYRIESFL
jgi:hypothetical protein